MVMMDAQPKHELCYAGIFKQTKSNAESQSTVSVRVDHRQAGAVRDNRATTLQLVTQ